MSVIIKDLIVVVLTVAGCLSDINWMDVPFWFYLIILVIYAGIRFSGRSLKVKDLGDDFKNSKKV